MEARANKPVKHGFDHSPGGQDPIPGSFLEVTDGTLTILNVVELLIGAGITLTEPGAGIAEIALPDPITFVPTLTGSVSNPNPTIGNSGRYVVLGKIAIYTFEFAWSHGDSAGSGDYSIDLPVPASVHGIYLWSASCRSVLGGGSIIRQPVDITPILGGVQLVYPATWPAGQETIVGSANPWAWGSGAPDVLTGGVIYETT